MPNDYGTLAELKSALPDAIPAAEGAYDAFLTTLLTRASRLFDVETKRRPGAYAMSTASSDEETRYYTGAGGSQQKVDEIVSISAVGISIGGGVQSTDYTTIPSSDYFLWPENAALEDRPYLRLDLDTLNGGYTYWPSFRKGVKLTGIFGYCDTADTPPDIKQAVITQAGRWFGRARQGYAGAGANAQLGQLVYTDKFDEDVQRVVWNYRRVTI